MQYTTPMAWGGRLDHMVRGPTIQHMESQQCVDIGSPSRSANASGNVLILTNIYHPTQTK